MNPSYAELRIRDLGNDIEYHMDAMKIAADKRRHLIIVLYEQHGYTLRRIAEIMGVSSARVSQIMGPQTPRRQEP